MPRYTGFGTTAADKPLSKLTFERRDVGKNDIRIDILFCGVCHSDLHFARNDWHYTVYPAVPIVLVFVMSQPSVLPDTVVLQLDEPFTIDSRP